MYALADEAPSSKDTDQTHRRNLTSEVFAHVNDIYVCQVLGVLIRVTLIHRLPFIYLFVTLLID